MSVLTTQTAVVVGLGSDASTVPGTTIFWAPLPTGLTTLTNTFYTVQGLGNDASTVQTSFDTVTITNTAVYASLKAAAAATSSTTSSITSSNDGSAATSSDGLSLGGKVGIGVAIPLVVIVAALLAIYYLRRRQGLRRDQALDTPLPQTGKPELYAGPVDTSIAGPIQRKPELPTTNGTQRPPELHDISIAEADPNAWKPKNRNARRKPVAATTASNTQDGPEQPLPPSYSYTDPALHATTTQSTEAELVEEADAAVQELGLLAMRKRTLVTQANAVGKRPEDIEGRKGEEYRELVVREQNVRRRLDDIEAERGG